MSAPSDSQDRALRWPLLIVGMLLLNMGICAVTIIAATSNPVTVEDDYYDKAVRYDQLRAGEAEQPEDHETNDTPAATTDLKDKDEE